MDAATVTIAARFHGPPKSGNGGYSCGCAARFIDGPAEVTLRAPPPLNTPMDVVRDGADVALQVNGKDIARAKPAGALALPPPAVSLEDARATAPRFRGLGQHAFRTCFVCGPQHESGLRIYSGPVRDDLVAAPWTPGADLADADGLVAGEFLWAVLDCPSYWALPNSGATPCVLGRLSAQIHTRPAPGAELVVVASPRGASGRKHNSCSAIYDAHGALIAQSESVWIEINPEQFA